MSARPATGGPATGAALAVVPLHPQACPGRPDELRWVTGRGTPSPVPADGLPSPLADLVAEGVLAAVHPEPDGLRTRLAPGRSWARDGARVRTAVHAALAEAAGGPAPSVGDTDADDTGTDDTGTDDAGTDDAALRAAAEDLVAGPVGAVAGSHGGTIELVDVRDGVVRVRLAGACDGCPAAGVTLRLRLEDELRRRCPQLREVRAVPGAPGRPGLLARWGRGVPAGSAS